MDRVPPIGVLQNIVYIAVNQVRYWTIIWPSPNVNSSDPKWTVFVWHNIHYNTLYYTAVYIWSGFPLTPRKKGCFGVWGVFIFCRRLTKTVRAPLEF